MTPPEDFLRRKVVEFISAAFSKFVKICAEKTVESVGTVLMKKKTEENQMKKKTEENQNKSVDVLIIRLAEEEPVRTQTQTPDQSLNNVGNACILVDRIGWWVLGIVVVSSAVKFINASFNGRRGKSDGPGATSSRPDTDRPSSRLDTDPSTDSKGKSAIKSDPSTDSKGKSVVQYDDATTSTDSKGKSVVKYDDATSSKPETDSKGKSVVKYDGLTSSKPGTDTSTDSKGKSVAGSSESSVQFL